MASLEQNKEIVRRFITEALSAGRFEVLEDLLAPGYVNRAMGDMDRAGFIAMGPMLKEMMPKRSMSIRELIAEGDVVIARFTFEWTMGSGEKIGGRGLTYYRLQDGKIVEDDPVTSPDLTQQLAAQMAKHAA